MSVLNTCGRRNRGETSAESWKLLVHDVTPELLVLRDDAPIMKNGSVISLFSADSSMADDAFYGAVPA